MKHFVLAITGPGGSGKSTVAKQLVKLLPNCAIIPVDHIKDMLVSGFFFDQANPDNPDGWGFNQWELVGDSIGLLAANFAENGFDIIIDGFLDGPAWVSLEKRIAITHKALLMPQLGENLVRDAGRPKKDALGKKIVSHHYHTFSTDGFYRDFTKIDTTNQTPEETVKAIKALL